MLGSLGLTMALASCSDDADTAHQPTPAPVDAARLDSAIPDGSQPDTRVVPHDAETSDAGPRAVVCAGSPCAKALVTGQDDSFCALLDDGTIACWGLNNSFTAKYMLGRGAAFDEGHSPVPARVVGLANVVSLGKQCAVDRDGAAWGWGTGPWLKDLTVPTTDEPVPVKLPIPRASLIDVRSDFNVAVGCAMTDAGVTCWGQDTFAQVTALDGGIDLTVPFRPTTQSLPAGAPVVAMSVGDATFLQRSDGSVLSWGATPTVGRVTSLVPTPYPGLLDQDGITSIDSVRYSACMSALGIAYCWGGELKGGAALPQPIVTPEPVVRISTTNGRGNTLDAQRACMIGVSGDVYCVGTNGNGQAGDGTTDYRFTPGKVGGLPGPAAEVKTIGGTSCALLTSGKVFCWGDNRSGALGYGATMAQSSVPGEVQLP